ncbi:ankyrin repeat-containing protein [Fusarium austroafricanum]|uniref:Ankyrin repeat-containing protein n=1 Tax=Fusarium austroafricanum TaxID=2364996 RepID=A0A8H4NNZ7_9HYPO|nr:ankyrin repeat-containing protein [Fusarium austroafricanum]
MSTKKRSQQNFEPFASVKFRLDDTELRTMLDNAELSRCTLARKGRHDACSTVEVRSHLSPDTIVRRFNKFSWAKGFKFDCDFKGITPLFEDPESSAVDIVAVPGLSSHAIGSWTLSDGSGDFWLRDFLPYDVPNARILVYGYDSKLDNSHSIENIETMGSALLQYLKAFRASTKTNDRPIIFIAHSLGGLIIKETLLKAHAQTNDAGSRGIAHGCYAILMLGVPNLGLRNREELQIIVQGQANESLIRDLVVDSNGQPQAYLRNLTREFARQDGHLAKTGKKMLLVSIESATNVGLTSVRDQYNIGLQKDHSGLSKLEKTDDYEIVLERLKPFVEEASRHRIDVVPDLNDQKHLSNVRRAISSVASGVCFGKSEQYTDTSWLFETSEYGQWSGSRPLSADAPGMITLQGGLGSGKTVLMKKAFEEAEKDKSSINMWHFFDGSSRDGAPSLKNCSRGLLFSLLGQLLDKVQQRPWEEIRKLSQQLQSYGDNVEVLSDEYLGEQIKDLLVRNKTMGSKIPCFRIFVDALEQCSGTDLAKAGMPADANNGMKKILRFLTDLVAMRGVDGVDIRICVSRRYTPTFGDLEPPTTIIKSEDHIGPLIKEFLRRQLAALPDKTLLDLLYPRLERHALNGYLWASLVLERIKAEARYSNRRELIHMVDHLPDRMEKMYQNALSSLARSKDLRAVRLLQLVLGAVEPLTIDQFRHAIACGENDSFFTIDEWERSRSSQPKGEAFITRLRELTYGLPTVSLPQISSWDYENLSPRPMAVLSEAPVVSFAHSTTANFLRNTAGTGSGPLAKELAQPQQHLTLFLACLRALELFGSGEDATKVTFIDYACEFWLHHARQADDLLVSIDRGDLTDFMLQCNDVTGLVLNQQKTLLQKSHAKEHFILGQQRTSFLVHLATFGCENLIKMHLEECRRCKDITNTQVRADLADALRNSITFQWHKTTQYLLDIYCQATGSLENDGYLLYKACYAEDVKAVEFLLRKGADPSVRHTRGYELPLHAAIAKGHKGIVALLLDAAGANAHSLLAQKRTKSGMTALHFVIDVGRRPHEKKALLQKMLRHVSSNSGILDVEDGNGNTPLALVREMIADKEEGSRVLEASLLRFRFQDEEINNQ